MVFELSRLRDLLKREAGDRLKERLIDQRTNESIDVEANSSQVSVTVYIVELRRR